MSPKRTSGEGKKDQGQGKKVTSQGKKAGAAPRRRRTVTPSPLPPPARPRRSSPDEQKAIRDTPDAQGLPWWLDHNSRQQPRGVRTYTELHQARLNRGDGARNVLESAADPQVRAQYGFSTTGSGSTASNPLLIHHETEIERLEPGTWVVYRGTENRLGFGLRAWPVFPPPNRVWYVWPQGVPGWRPRVQSDGPPAYDWEDYRDYIDAWNLPIHFQNNRRNGEVNHHSNIYNRVAEYPRADIRSNTTYSLDRRDWTRLEPWLANADPATQRIVVHSFPYRLTVEPLTDANRNFRRRDQVQWQSSPWRSFRRAERGVAPASPQLEPLDGSTSSGEWRFVYPQQDGALARLNGFANATEVHEYTGRSAEARSAMTALGLSIVRVQNPSNLVSRRRSSLEASAESNDQHSKKKRSRNGRERSQGPGGKKRKVDDQGTSIGANRRTSPQRVSVNSYVPINPLGLPRGGYWTWEPELSPAEMNRRNNAYLGMLSRNYGLPINPDIVALTLMQLTRRGRFEFRSPGDLASWLVADLDTLAGEARIDYPTRAETAYYYMNSSDDAREILRTNDVEVIWIPEDHELYHTHVVGNEAPGGDAYSLYYIGMRVPRAEGSPVPAGDAATTGAPTPAGGMSLTSASKSANVAATTAMPRPAGGAAPTAKPIPAGGMAPTIRPAPAGTIRISLRSRTSPLRPLGKSRERTISATQSEAEGTSASSSSPISDRCSTQKKTKTTSKPARRQWQRNMSDADWYEIGHHGGIEAPKWKERDRNVYKEWQEIAKWKQQRERRDKKRAAGQKASAPNVQRSAKEKAAEDDFFKRWHHHFGVQYDNKDLESEYSISFPDSKRQKLGIIEKQKRVTARLSGKTDRAGTQIQPKTKDRPAYSVMLQKWMAARHAAAGQFKPSQIRLVDARLERHATAGDAALKRAAKSAATPERRREVEHQRALAVERRVARAKQRNACGEYDDGDDDDGGDDEAAANGKKHGGGQGRGLGSKEKE